MNELRRITLALAFVAGAVSSAAYGPIRSAADDQVRIEVLAYIADHNLGGGSEQVCFVSLNGHDPTRRVLARLRNRRLAAPIQGISASNYYGGDSSPVQGVKARATGGPGIVLRVGAVRWLGAMDVEVVGGYYINGVNASESIYALRKRNGRWRVVKETVQWVS